MEIRQIIVVTSVLLVAACSAAKNEKTEATADSARLVSEFRQPPDEARPRVWWHWMNGNVTIDGIDKDLEWMKRIGIGGVQNFDANLSTPQIVPERLIYMQPEWQKAFVHAVNKADSLGLEFAIAASPGWSETGGPWVPPEDGMKKLVWHEQTVRGGTRVANPQAALPLITGPYQQVPFNNVFGAGNEEKSYQAGDHIVTLAIPRLIAPLDVQPAIQSAGESVDQDLLTDDSVETAITVDTATADGEADITLNYPQPVTIRSARIFVKHAKPPFSPAKFNALLQARRGNSWQDVGTFVLSEAASTIHFNAVEAADFRVVLTHAPGRSAGDLGSVPGAETMQIFQSAPTTKIEVGELKLFSADRLAHAEAKAGYDLVPEYSLLNDNVVAQGPDTADVIDLTSVFSPDGTNEWTAPAGSDWTLLQFGWSLTGKTNHPATPEATGLEVDKYDAAAVRRYLTTYLDMYQNVVGKSAMGTQGIRALLTDSIEVGHANWTPTLLREFSQRRGYDATPWLPAIAGIVIESPAASDAFLFDFRQTLGELITEAHYKTVAEVAHEYGLKVYGEALEDGRPVLGDDLDMRRYADIPMAALWTFGKEQLPRQGLLGDMKGAASVANFYGKKYVAAESMTAAFSPWAFAPKDLKHVIDREFAYGINRPVVHTSVHQPVDDKQPGLSLAIFGQYFNRHESWAEMAGPWVDYLSRSAYLLQQGSNQADVAFFIGEDTPVATLFSTAKTGPLPLQFGYDLLSAEMLASLKIDGTELVSPGGARYKALMLGGTSEVMTLASLKVIASIAEAGIPVTGTQPRVSPRLGDDPRVFQSLAKNTWSLPDVHTLAAESPDETLGRIGLTPALTLEDASAQTDIRFIHRQLADADIYFIHNTANKSVNTTALLRGTGKSAARWDPVSGKRYLLDEKSDGVTTQVPLALSPLDSVFIVIDDSTGETAISTPVMSPETIPVSFSDWQVSLDAPYDSPADFTMTTLQPLNESDDAAIRYFSGIARYHSSFNWTGNPGGQITLSLGEIGDVADVLVNGKSAGVVWLPPYELDVTDLLEKGENTLEIRVANLWVNRLIGDKQPDAEVKAWVAAPTYFADAPLRPAGLIGPLTFSVIPPAK